MIIKLGSKRKFIYRSAEWIYLFAGSTASALTWLIGVEKDEEWLAGRTLIWAIIEKLQSYAIYLYIFLAIIVVICLVVKRWGDPWVIEKIQFILDGYQEKVFSASRAPRDHNRVTLFKHHKSCLLKRHWTATSPLRPWGDRKPFSEYLVPYLRSGHLAQKTGAIFYVDSNNSERTEGVAGMAWAQRQVAHLPDLPEVVAATGKRIKKQYATATKCDVKLMDKYLSEGRQPPRSIAAIPVECHGKLWGVIVLDSRDPLGVTEESIQNYTLTVALIGQLLERV